MNTSKSFQAKFEPEKTQTHRENVNYRPGMAFMRMLSAFGPFVYLLMISGRIICSGVSGTAKRLSFSLGTSYSISFKRVIDSVAKPIFLKKA
jgi:hypothetical protein